jgi:hypothetical protein
MQEGLLVPAYGVGRLHNVTSGVAGLRILMVNVFAVSQPDDSWTLVDAGLPFLGRQDPAVGPDTVPRPAPQRHRSDACALRSCGRPSVAGR